MIVWENPSRIGSESTDWWMGQILWVEGGARDPKVPTLFQVADVDTGCINLIKIGLATHIVARF